MNLTVKLMVIVECYMTFVDHVTLVHSLILIDIIYVRYY